MKRAILAAMIAGAFAIQARAGDDHLGIPHIGDENDLSWLYRPNAKPFLSDATSASPKSYVESGDENNLSWLYQAPTAKFADPARDRPTVGFVSQPLAATSVASAPAKPFVEFGDENNLSWLYQAPTARYADPARQHPSIGYGPQQVPFATQLGSIREKLEGHKN